MLFITTIVFAIAAVGIVFALTLEAIELAFKNQYLKGWKIKLIGIFGVILSIITNLLILAMTTICCGNLLA